MSIVAAVFLSGNMACSRSETPAILTTSDITAAEETIATYLGHEFESAPEVLQGGAYDAAIDVMAERDSRTPEFAPYVLEISEFREALGLSAEAQTRDVRDVAGFYDRDQDAIFVRDSSAASARSVLAHELVHAALSEIWRSKPETYDQSGARWMLGEGLAQLAEGSASFENESSSEADEVSGVPPISEPFGPTGGQSPKRRDGLGVEALVYRLGYTRVLFEQPILEGESWSGIANRIQSSAPMLDLRVGLGWKPVEVELPVPPVGSETVRRDRLGVLGWAEILGGSRGNAQIAALDWRGDAVVAYRDDRNRACVAARVALITAPRAEAFASGLREAVGPSATIQVSESEVELESCVAEETTFDSEEADVDLSVLGGFVEATLMAADPTRTASNRLSPDMAWCIADIWSQSQDSSQVYRLASEVVEGQLRHVSRSGECG